MSNYVVVTSTSNTITVIDKPTTVVVGDSAMRGPIGPVGPPGPTGATGPAGPAGLGANVAYDQANAAYNQANAAYAAANSAASFQLPVANGSSKIDIPTANGAVSITTNGTHTWKFESNGSISLPVNDTNDSHKIFLGNNATLLYYYDTLFLQSGITLPNLHYTSMEQGVNYWDAFNEINQENGNSAWSWIHSELYTQNTPTIFLETKKLNSNANRWNFDANGVMTVPGDVLPNVNVTYSLGSSNKRFKDIWLSNSTIYLGSASISENNSLIITANNGNKSWSFDANGNLILPANGDIKNSIGNSVLGGGALGLPLANGASKFDIALVNGAATINANVFVWTFDETNGSIDLPGNVTNYEACSAINFVANSSGDGNGYSTIELRPDSNATNDQYLIIDPTVVNHIHIRAGGQQDNSNAQLYFGGENSYFKVSSGENPPTEIAANNFVWSFNADGTITFPDSTIQTTGYTGTDIITVKKVFETTNSLSAATGVVTHDCDNGHIFVHSSISANFTANFTNTTIAPNTATAFTLVLNQGATAYVPTAVQIGGQAQTVNWQGGTQPAGNANKKDVISFSVVNNNGTWITLGQLTSFG